MSSLLLCSVRSMLHCLLLQVIKMPKYNNRIILNTNRQRAETKARDMAVQG